MLVERQCFLADICDHRQLGSLVGRVEEYEQLLEELSLRAGLEDQALIRRTLDRVTNLDCMIVAPADPSRSYLRRTMRNQHPEVAKSRVCTKSLLGSTKPMLELVLPNRWIALTKITTETPPPVPQDIMARIRR